VPGILFRPDRQEPSPGQFLEIKVCDNGLPLLRRPVSIHGIKGSKVKVIYEVVGEGTRILSGRGPGEFLDIIGPLGKGFTYAAKNTGASPDILVAGGMGVAPLVFLAGKMKPDKNLVLIGARSKKQILCRSEFRNLGCKVLVATDDGSSGFKGKVTELLKEILSKQACPTGFGNIYACGPQPMLKAVAEISGREGIPCQLSLERHMACGFGACLGCVVSTKSGYKRVCKEGPVFAAEELTW
jgi:dihydroorotate dehydrogenase electron transfer subunit